MPYAATTDMLIGDLPTSAALEPSQFLNDAADEIDSKIGFLYEVPIDTTTAPKPVSLLLKRINAHLATARFILAATVLVEDTRLNAYGQQLLAESEAALDSIATGAVILDGVIQSGLQSAYSTKAPLIANGDSESAVDAFYNRIASPSYVYPYGTSVNEGFVR